MKKRLLSMLLCLCMVVGMVPIMVQTAQAAGTGVVDRLNALKSKYPDGAYWNHYVTASYLDGDSLLANKNEAYAESVTWTCCATHSARGSVGQYDCNYFDGGLQCWGFARRIFYEVFGVRCSALSRNYNPANVQVGDYVRFGSDSNGHSFVVTGRSGNTVTIVECNFGNRCQIKWGRQFDITANVYGMSFSYSYHAPNYDEVNGPSYPTAAQNPGSDFYAYISYPNGNLNLENRNNNVQTAAVRTADPRQIWRFVRLNDGTYSIMNLYDGRYLDIYDAGGSGANVWVYPSNGSGAQKWKIVQDAYGMSGAYNLVASYDNAVALDVSDASKNTGTNVQAWARNGTVAQAFKITKISNINSVLAYNAGEDFYAQISYNGGYLQTTGTEADLGMDVRVTKNANASDPKQIWHFIRQTSGAYKIVNEYSGWCLDVRGGIVGNNKNVWTYYDDHGDVPERWYLLYSPGDSGYRFVTAISFPGALYSIDIPGGDVFEGANAEIYQQNENAWQLFKITKVNYNPVTQLVLKTPPTATAITYGQQLMDSKLSGGVVVDSNGKTIAGFWSWDGLSTTRPAASGEYEALFMPATEENSSIIYSKVTAKVPVTVNKAPLKLTAPTASPIEQGQKLSASKLTGGLALDPDGRTVSGTWSWETPDVVPTGGSYTAVFTPTLSSAYSTGTVRVSITVQQSGCAGGHTWGAWSVSAAATCTQAGMRVRTCTKCGAQETEAVAALGHSFALSGGVYVCTVCGYTQSSSATAGLDNFKPTIPYSDSTFWDVSSSAWYGNNVASAYRFGLMNGRAAGRFSPEDNVTLAEAITMAARIHSIYYHGEENFERYDGGNWFDPYVNYARANNICTENYSYNTPATREEFVHILANALPQEELARLPGNNISFADEGSIVYAGEVDRLCGAGIINGVDVGGLSYFMPSKTVKRSEAAAIITRMVQPDLRLS